MVVLSGRLAEAVDYARAAHAIQTRKGSGIPYLYHLLGVASLVLEFGGTEDQVIAGLLHDVIEDCGAEHEAAIRDRFGDVVANIVVACTDGTAEGKAARVDPGDRRSDWLARKRAYLAHLVHAPDDVLLVSACDKLHNARAIVQDLEDPKVGDSVFGRFTGGQDGTLGYYEALARTFRSRGVTPADCLESTVARMHMLSGTMDRVALV